MEEEDGMVWGMGMMAGLGFIGGVFARFQPNHTCAGPKWRPHKCAA